MRILAIFSLVSACTYIYIYRIHLLTKSSNGLEEYKNSSPFLKLSTNILSLCQNSIFIPKFLLYFFIFYFLLYAQLYLVFLFDPCRSFQNLVVFLFIFLFFFIFLTRSYKRKIDSNLVMTFASRSVVTSLL
jgi:hypothetical protein